MKRRLLTRLVHVVLPSLGKLTTRRTCGKLIVDFFLDYFCTSCDFV
jgi:hypothetical protein